MLTIPCGKCEGCQLRKAAEWAIRCVHEARYHKRNSFLTLTYDTPHLPKNNSLIKKDLVDFWKRLREHLDRVETYLKINEPYYGPWQPVPIKYFACGEYGEVKGRPHYHAVLFGWDFPDREPVNNNPWAKDPLYESKTLNKLWGNGVCKIGDLTASSAAYTARYTMKKIYGAESKALYEDQGKIPPFNLMSKGIGRRFFNEFQQQIFTCDFVRNPETKQPQPVPRFYDKLLQALDAEKAAHVKDMRQQKQNRANPEDSTPERLEMRHESLKLRTKFFKHSRKGTEGPNNGPK